MLTKEEAQEIAITTINALGKKEGRDYILFKESAIEREYAWAFPFNTREYVETEDVMDMVIGIGPVVVNRQSGEVMIAPPMPIERYLEQYQAELQRAG